MFSLFTTKTATVVSPDDPTVRRSHLSPQEFTTLPAGEEVKVMGDIFEYTVSHWLPAGESELICRPGNTETRSLAPTET